jgi:hypothetical protein
MKTILTLTLISLSSVGFCSDRYVTLTNITLRAASNVKSDALGVIPAGSNIEVLAVSGNTETIETYRSHWYKTKFEGKVGWIFGGFLAKSSAETNQSIGNYQFVKFLGYVGKWRGKNAESKGISISFSGNYDDAILKGKFILLFCFDEDGDVIDRTDFDVIRVEKVDRGYFLTMGEKGISMFKIKLEETVRDKKRKIMMRVDKPAFFSCYNGLKVDMAKYDNVVLGGEVEDSSFVEVN